MTSPLRRSLAYTHPLRRRARIATRHLRTAADPRSYVHVPIVPTYWWDDALNFGDLLTVELLRAEHIGVVHRRPRFAALTGVGSIIEHLPPDYRGTIWGSGLMFDRDVRFPEATFLAVRGELSRDHLGLAAGTALGDPGLLYASRFTRRTASWRVGLIPHFTHRHLPDIQRIAAWGSAVHVIDPAASPRRVAKQISACDAVVTSSLHGLIFADAIGIPATWLNLASQLVGGDFKFRDHESVVHRGSPRVSAVEDLRTLADVARVARVADAKSVADAVGTLRSTLAAIRTLAGEYEASPLSRHAFTRHDSFGSLGTSMPEI